MQPSSRAGHFVTQESGSYGKYKAFIPATLPPKPPLAFDAELRELEARANVAIGRLDGITRLLPNPDLFLYMYVRKEAVLSSQIEGTQSSLSDLLLYEDEAAPSVPTSDVEEVSSYIAAMNHGMKRLDSLPLSTRLLREIHHKLLRGTRGSDKTPGEIRTSQNWIGGNRPDNAFFVPPPAHALGELLSNLEKFLHDDPEPTPTLVKTGIAHAQFETIHPFLDGNGRVGRLLITLTLLSEKVLELPILYMSLHFKENRTEYYDRLQRVRTHGDWEGWLGFFLSGVATVADSACTTIQQITKLFRTDYQRIQSEGGRAAGSALRVFEHACQHAMVSISNTAKALKLTRPTVAASVELLERLRILSEVTGKQRDRRFVYKKYVKILAA